MSQRKKFLCKARRQKKISLKMHMVRVFRTIWQRQTNKRCLSPLLCESAAKILSLKRLNKMARQITRRLKVKRPQKKLLPSKVKRSKISLCETPLVTLI